MQSVTELTQNHNTQFNLTRTCTVGVEITHGTVEACFERLQKLMAETSLLSRTCGKVDQALRAAIAERLPRIVARVKNRRESANDFCDLCGKSDQFEDLLAKGEDRTCIPCYLGGSK
jgi:hypothetical protein